MDNLTALNMIPRAHTTSGWKYIACYKNRRRPYQVIMQNYRSIGYQSLHEAAGDVASRLASIKSVGKKKMKSDSISVTGVPSVLLSLPQLLTPEQKKNLKFQYVKSEGKQHFYLNLGPQPDPAIGACVAKHLGKSPTNIKSSASSKKFSPKKTTTKSSTKPSTKSTITKPVSKLKKRKNCKNLEPKIPVAVTPVAADDWMTKPKVSFSENVQLFGARIMMKRGRSNHRPAVIKAWNPIDPSIFVVVFDDRSDIQYSEDLIKLRKRWYRIPWDDDVEATAELRPMCPECGIALGEGAAAWTQCHGCGRPEPGAMSWNMGSRIRGNDPYRYTYRIVDDDVDDN